MLETLSMLVHGDSKVGKTTLAATAPLPLLVLDAEGGWKFLPMRMTQWDPVSGPPPTYDGTWDVCHVMVRSWDTLGYAFQWLQTGQHQFRSVVVDSISEIQRRLKENLVGTEALKQQDWGRLLALMDNVIRGFRDLTLHHSNPVMCVIFIAETRQDNNGKWKPYLQGAIAVALPYWMDIVGYLSVQDAMNAAGQYDGTKVRRLLISPNAQYEAGERVQGRLPGTIDNPNVSQMLIDVYPQLQSQ